MEYVMDLHRYSYFQRTLSRAARPLYSRGTFALGFAVEGRELSELPEQISFSCQMEKVDFDNLVPIEAVYDVPKERVPGHKRW